MEQAQTNEVSEDGHGSCEVMLGKDIVLREREVLTDLLDALPLKAQLGFTSLKDKLFNRNDSTLKKIITTARTNDVLKVEYTCLDVTAKFICLGCNLGIVFFYDRGKHKLSRFVCENRQVPITSIKLLDSHNFVTSGQFSGTITIFNYAPKKNEQMEVALKCTVDSHHTAPITDIKWTTDGTKLFTADSAGHVAITIITMDEGKTHTVFICKEDSAVVQLAFSHTALLISTLRRTLIWPFNTKTIVQVGQQERKTYGNFGACYLPPAGDLPSDVPLTVFAARPGLRVWKATNEGKVLSTMIYKDSINAGEPIIQTLHLPSRLETPVAGEQRQFGILLPFNGKFLATWQGSCVWVLDPDTGCVIGCHSNLGRVIHIGVCGNELLILTKGEEHFIRRIVYETRMVSHAIDVQEIDLNNPYEVAESQLGSSFSHFQDTDKLNKLFDDIVTNVKTQAKRIKNQITAKDSEDFDSSDTDHLVSSPRLLQGGAGVQGATANGNISTASDGERSDRRRSGSDSKTSSSDGEAARVRREGFRLNASENLNADRPVDLQRAFESSGDFESSGKVAQTLLAPKNQGVVKRDASFKHLSTQQFPCDIVFEGTSKQKPRKKSPRGASKGNRSASDSVSADAVRRPGDIGDTAPITSVQTSVAATAAGADADVDRESLARTETPVAAAKAHLAVGSTDLADRDVAVVEPSAAWSSAISCDPTARDVGVESVVLARPDGSFVAGGLSLEVNSPSTDALRETDRPVQMASTAIVIDTDQGGPRMDSIVPDRMHASSSHAECDSAHLLGGGEQTLSHAQPDVANGQLAPCASAVQAAVLDGKHVVCDHGGESELLSPRNRDDSLEPNPSSLGPSQILRSERASESEDSIDESGHEHGLRTALTEDDITLAADGSCDGVNPGDLRGRMSPTSMNGFLPSGQAYSLMSADRPLELAAKCDSHVVFITHRRQGSNASGHSTASERAKHVRGEALEQVHSDLASKAAEHGDDDSIVANLLADHVDIDSLTVPDEREIPLPERPPEPPPFPAPQLGNFTSIYSHDRVSVSDISIHDFSIQEPASDDQYFLNYEDVNYVSDSSQDMAVVISSGEETDAEDNRSHSPPIEIESSEARTTLPVRSKTNHRPYGRSFTNSPTESDSDVNRYSASPKGAAYTVDDRLRLLADSWAEATGPGCGTSQSVALSDVLLWVVDQHDHVFYTSLMSRTYAWKKLDGRAQMISSNQQGTVVWCINRQKVAFYRTGIKDTCPQGNDWAPFEKDMHYVCVDVDCVWAIKANGDVFLRTGVTVEKPSGSGWRTIKASSDLVQISAFAGLVWGLDIYNHVQIFQGDVADETITVGDHSSSWSELAGITASFVSLGPKGVCWIIDRDCGVWFNQDVSKEDPKGGRWYQLSLGENVSQNSFSSVLSFFRSGNEPKMLVANDISGVWILGKHGSLHVTYGHLLGTRWELSVPPHVNSSSCWTCVSAGAADMNRGFVWALQPNGQLFCFKTGEQSYNVHPPPKVVLKNVSAGMRSLWALTSSQEVYVRLGISDACPQGLKWSKADMETQGNRRLIDISCGNRTVWAVDFEGHPWFQVGREHRRNTDNFSPAWIGIEGCPMDGCKFVKIVVGPDDRVVWACDDKSNVYARKDVTEDFWIGNSWELVAGTSGKDLAISSSQVWALCPNGDVICRFGVSRNNVLGDYWKKVPGSFEQLSVSNNDELWGIDRHGQLYQRQTLLFYGSALSKRAPSYSELFPADGDWELI